MLDDGSDREEDTATTSLGSPNVELPIPLFRLGGGYGHCLFPALYREPGAVLQYAAAGFQQLTWGVGDRQDLEDEHDGREPCCEDEGTQVR